MKRLLCTLLAAALVFCLWGCRAGQAQIEDGVNFYYLRANLTYGAEDSVIACEVRERGEDGGLESLLRRYLQGPEDDALRTPFPRGTELAAVTQEDSTLNVVLRVSLSELSALNRTLACACLTKTCLELSDDITTVQIWSEDGLAAGEAPIVMDAESLLLLDTGSSQPTEK